MALMFPWATKEYLLWEMSLGQIVMYHNLAIEIKSGKAADGGEDGKPKSLTEYTYDELKAKRDELRAQYGDI